MPASSKTRALNPGAILALGEGTRGALDDALILVLRMDAKFLGGGELTADENARLVAAQQLVNTFSGEVILQAVRMMFVDPRGQRVIAAALPTPVVVAVGQSGVATVQDFERDEDGELRRVVSRPLQSA